MRKMLSWYQRIEVTTFRAYFYPQIISSQGEPLCLQSIDCCVVSGSLWYNQVSFMVINHNRKSFRSPRKNSKCCSDNWYRWRFWSAFRHFGTHCAESFRVFKSSWLMNPNGSREMPSCSAIDLDQFHPYSKISSWFWLIISEVVTVLVRTRRGAIQVEKLQR